MEVENINKKMKEQRSHTNGIDLVKYVAAILVIFFHCEKVFQDPAVNHLFKNVLCRFAVPYFLISTSYFVRRGQNQSADYIQQYVKSLTKSYLFWSLIYLPIGFQWIQENYSLSPVLYPVAFVAGLVYTGTYYHLWYIPAAIFGIICVQWLLKKSGYVVLFSLALLMYGFGAIETYYAYIGNEKLKAFFDQYLNLFITTRNGLFFALIFVAIGFFLWDHQEKIANYQKYFGLSVLATGVLLVVEGMVVYSNIGIDKNFMWMLIPFTSSLFCWSLFVKVEENIDIRRLRELGKYYFFIHPLCILWTANLVNSYDFFANTWLQLIVTLVATHLLSSLTITMTQQLPCYYFDLQLMLKINRTYIQKLI
ncbi:acyltransferase [Enterococcus ureilyticus]|uniref:acyltransferase family protein n=1 Tax=Enterococcus ureilyticus TaxID=1131292 RepID=UPI001A924354|nr:acyltransferase [Enterococcus ureilyticus]MBO0446131.1 acyltransferase [Enterococcus ureilyticus]